MIKRENEGLKQENQLMRDRVAELSRELETGARGGVPTDALNAECRRLRTELQEKERELLKQGDQMRSLLGDKDQVASK